MDIKTSLLKLRNTFVPLPQIQLFAADIVSKALPIYTDDYQGDKVLKISQWQPSIAKLYLPNRQLGSKYGVIYEGQFLCLDNMKFYPLLTKGDELTEKLCARDLKLCDLPIQEQQELLIKFQKYLHKIEQVEKQLKKIK